MKIYKNKRYNQKVYSDINKYKILNDNASKD